MDENKRQQKSKAALKKAKQRANQSAEKKLKEQAKNAQRMAKERADDDKKLAENARDAQRKADARANYSEGKKMEENAKNAQSKANARANYSEAKKEEENEKLAERMAKLRKARATGVSYRAACHNEDVMSGKMIVLPLEETEDAIGDMDVVCPHCGALKFKGEPPSTCCNNGKIKLVPFPRPPQPIMDLWMGTDARSRIFRQHSRTINNGVCLSSIQVKERVDGFTPSVIFQGKVMHRIGALSHVEGETPVYSQLYVLDSDMELTQRFQNMSIPASMSSKQRDVLKSVVETVQDAIHAVNPFTADFKQVLEIPEEDLTDGKVVISAKGPSTEHERRYNLPTNLKEVSIVTNSKPNDMVLHLRGGGLQTISDLNPKGMPLHFTLLFPYGTYGWDMTVMKQGGKRRVTPREFYCYHLNVRKGENGDFLHRAGRLFQEWICMGWIVVEDQRLFFQSQNQKALRADSYGNVKDHVDQMKQKKAKRD